MNIKREACSTIAAALSAGVSSLTGKCEASQADEEVLAPYPSLRVIPRRFTFTPFEEEEIDIASTTQQLVNVGDFEGEIELRIFTLSQKERGDLEQDVLDFMFSAEGSGGSLFCKTQNLTLAGVSTLYPAPLIACLDDEEWREEMVFDKKRFSFLTLSVAYPALVVRNAPDIDQLFLAIAYDLDATTPDATSTIDENGNLANS